MLQYFIYYVSSDIAGVIIFGIMLAHDRMSIDKQEKQLKYDHPLIAFMMISHPFTEAEIKELATEIRECMHRADEKLYSDKEYYKFNGKSTFCK
ncbi:hypothetical protein [Ruminococcus sp.]|uniref:hypothetical protein n=1 Tax=Ruminococcus sp. TaxID=41978 RepID=UPI001B50D0DA|nr:hypothetical protein [Ruminococcus sp.]MBP5431132.1 hypothetical protein [Ruminococcus sp.]